MSGDAGLAAGIEFVHDWPNCLPSSRLVAASSTTVFVFFSVQLTKAHRQGHMVKVDWLDRLTFREIEMINEVSWFSLILSQNCIFIVRNIFEAMKTVVLVT